MLTRLVRVTEMNVEIKALRVPKQFQLWLLLLIVPALTGQRPGGDLHARPFNQRTCHQSGYGNRTRQLSKFEAILIEHIAHGRRLEGRCAHGTST